MMSHLSEEARIAVEAARLGGDVLLKYWRQLVTQQIHEKSRGDLVTAADLDAEERIAEFLIREMPEAGIVSEEGTSRQGTGPVWYVDPLDGTTNFVQRFPVFAVSVGLAESAGRLDARLLAGAVFNPVSGQLFYAARGRGAYANDQRIRVSAKTELGDAVIATGFPRRYNEELKSYLLEFESLFPVCRAVRRAGAAALDLCWTAESIFDGFWEHRLAPWDIAAGAIIVEEAGGHCTDFAGERAFLQSGNIIGAPPAVHTALLKTIREVREREHG